MGHRRVGPAVAASCLRLIILAPLFVAGEAEGWPEATCSASGCSKGINMMQLHGRPSVDINNNWLIVNNKWYSRKGAHDALLGRVGRTNGIWVRPVLVNFRTSAPKEWLDENVNISTTLTLTSAQSQKIAAAVHFKTPMVSASAGVTSGSSHNASYVLRGLTFDCTWKIKRWFNNDANKEFVQDYMDMYDGSRKPRIVTTVWVMVKGDAEHGMSCTGGHLSLSFGSAGVNISGAGCTQSTWSFDPDTIIAYETSYLEMENMHTNPPSGRVKHIAADWYWTR